MTELRRRVGEMDRWIESERVEGGGRGQEIDKNVEAK